MSSFDPFQLFSTFFKVAKREMGFEKSGFEKYILCGREIFLIRCLAAAQNHYVQSLDDNRGIRGGGRGVVCLLCKFYSMDQLEEIKSI